MFVKMNFIEKNLVNSTIYNFFYSRTFLHKFLDFCQLKGDVLEIGCGQGFTSAEIYKRFRCSLTSTDYDDEQVRQAKKKLADKNIRVLQADARNLPFEDVSFDCVVETNMLHHIPEFQNVFTEVKRVLKKGGSFFLMDISHTFLWPFLYLLPFDSFPGKFTKEQMILELENAGFKIVKQTGKNIFKIHAIKS